MKTYKAKIYSDKNRSWVKESEIRNDLEKILEQSGIKGVVGLFDDDKEYFPVSVSRLNQYRLNETKYRVYIGDWAGPVQRTFIQSDDDGVLDVEKLIAKAAEKYEENTRSNEREKKIEMQAKERENKADELSERVEKFGLSVFTTKFGDFRIVGNAEQIEKLVELLEANN